MKATNINNVYLNNTKVTTFDLYVERTDGFGNTYYVFAGKEIVRGHFTKPTTVLRKWKATQQ